MQVIKFEHLTIRMHRIQLYSLVTTTTATAKYINALSILRFDNKFDRAYLCICVFHSVQKEIHVPI